MYRGNIQNPNKGTIMTEIIEKYNHKFRRNEIIRDLEEGIESFIKKIHKKSIVDEGSYQIGDDYNFNSSQHPQNIISIDYKLIQLESRRSNQTSYAIYTKEREVRRNCEECKYDLNQKIPSDWFGSYFGEYKLNGSKHILTVYNYKTNNKGEEKELLFKHIKEIHENKISRNKIDFGNKVQISPFNRNVEVIFEAECSVIKKYTTISRFDDIEVINKNMVKRVILPFLEFGENDWGEIEE